MAFDLEDPDGQDDYRSAFFASDYRTLPDAQFVNWINPGDNWFRVRGGVNADGTIATPAEVSAAVSTWQGMTQGNRWRIRLHHQGLVWIHDNQPKIEIAYYTGIPAHLADEIRLILVEDEFEYLGQTASQVRTKLDNRNPTLLEHFWPDRVMPTVVYGWEDDAQ